MPKPAERFVFLALALCVPIGVFVAGMRFFRPKVTSLSSSPKLVTLLAVVALCALYLPLLGFGNTFGKTSRFEPYKHFALLITLLALGAAAFWYRRPASQKFRWQSGCWIAWSLFLPLVLLQVVSWRLLTENSINLGGEWFDSGDAVLYSIGQVASGKMLLVDFPSQYGFYALVLQPLLALVGMSVFKTFAIFAAMQIISLAAVFSVVQTMLRNMTLRLTYTLALVTVTFGTIVWSINLGDPYLQYWPIRFFWPALSLFAFHRYVRTQSLQSALWVSLIGAVGSLWNPDSGLVIVIAFAGVLVAKWWVLRTSKVQDVSVERHQTLKAMALHVVTFAVVALLASSWLTLKAASPIHWDWLVSYQQTFYGLGFMMIPLPIYPFPWMSVLGIYLFGLIIAVQMWVHNPRSKNAEILVFLALLGLGLFVYYTGRSHPLNLFSVCWPAVTMMTLLADRALRGVNARALGRNHLVYPVAALSVLLIFSAPMLVVVPKMLASAANAFQTRNTPADIIVSSELAFVRQHTQPGDSCAIIAKRQGVYHLATHTVSPLAGPGFAEMLLQRDLDNFLRQLETVPMTCIFIGTGESSQLFLKIDPLKYLQRYAVVASSSSGTMLLMRPRL